MPATTLPAPRGLSFSIEDLQQVRGWAEQQDLRLLIILDHTEDDSEFEEMLVLCPRGRSQRRLCVWREAGGVLLRHSNQQAYRFSSMSAALSCASQAPRRRGWSGLWGRRRPDQPH